MSNILIYTSGTLGDHLPFVALGQMLTARGHRVRMAINKAMHVYARKVGLEAVALTDIERGPEEARENAWAWDHWNNPDLAHHPKAKPLDMEGYIIRARELIDLCRDADLLISTSIRTLGYVAHSSTGLPWLTVSMNPYTFWQPVLAEEREAWERGRFEEYRNHKGILAYLFAELDIDKPPPSWSMGWLFARHIILASSPFFSLVDLNQLQPRSSIDMAGFWFYEDPDWQNWQPDEALLRFMERRPIVLSFSSQPLEDPGRILRLHVEATAQIGRPLLVLKGWAGFTAKDLPPTANFQDILFADFIPHDWVFSKAECAILHGGIGSIARALRQGCPLLIEPFGNDQIHNASCVSSLGVGAAMHPFKMTAEDLVKVLSEKVLIPICRQRAQALGTKILTEKGLETSCHLIENYLSWPRPPRSSDEEKTWQVPSLYNRSLPQGSDMPGQDQDPAKSAQENHGKSIPKIIHQTWKDKNLPPDFVRFQHSWQMHHPGWRYYLWTDTDNREFLKKYYPWFLSIYDNYPEPIMRADAVRYFILHHHGGVYVDLDFECLKPLDPLLTDRELVLGLEPSKHLEIQFPQGRPFHQIVCNAFLASLPKHPFWEHVFKQLIAYHRAPGPLDATGPFLLTRSYESYLQKETITIEPSDIIYPISGEKPWDELPPEVQTRVTRTAYAIHHWRGTWWREAVAKRTQQVKVSLLVRGEIVNVSAMIIDVSLAQFRAVGDRPWVSCLMVTKNRPGLAKGAVHCFQQQTYPNKELVIVDDGEDDSLNQWIEELRDERINYVRLPAENRLLGELRNIAVEKARGAYVAQWDDDDLSDPMRLEVQLATIHMLQTDACFLEREQIWWPKNRRLGLSTRRIWEGSFLCAKNKLPLYPAQRQGEDTPVIGKIVSDGRTALLDFPQLYVYVFHGENTFTAERWEAHWLAATESYEGNMYDIMIRQLQDRLGLDLSSWMSQELTSSPLGCP